MRFGTRLSAWQVDNHLRRWGFESPKQARRAFMINPAREGASRWPDQITAEASIRLL